MEEAQLAIHRNDLTLLRAMWDQTCRDCERFGYFPDPLEGELRTFQGYLHCFSGFYAGWCKMDSSRLASLLYHIDIPEKLLPLQYGCRNPAEMAELILKRELIKVIIRKHYSH